MAPDMDHHPQWRDVTFTGAYWNCEERLDALLQHVRPWFANILVVVQKSPDDTLEVARGLADVVIEDEWHGRGDPSIHRAVAAIKTKYSFVISDDEWPSEDLLASLQDLVNTMRAQSKDGAWITFHSSIDTFDFTRPKQGHLRFFETRVGWPSTPHARPMTNRTLFWETGHVDHDRSLDEMMIDYVRRYDLCAGRKDWGQMQRENARQIRNAPTAIAERRGWEYVKGFDWWPRVRDIAFEGRDPE